jgi:hypothetical protein
MKPKRITIDHPLWKRLCKLDYAVNKRFPA